jgi:F0F1-type ATP synthase membrane subunit b/b'
MTMADDLDDDAIVVTLPDEGDGGTITKVEVGEKKVVADDPIADLKGQFDALKGTTEALKTTNQTLSQRLTTTEQQLSAKDREIAEVRGQVTDSQLDTVLSGIQAAEAEATAAEQACIAAAEAGDFAAQARAQRKMAAAEARVQRLTEAKGDLEEAKTTKTTQRTEARTEPRQPVVDPVEAIASKMAPRAAAWLRSHRECVTDSSKNTLMMKTHHQALADGLEEGGDDYFARLDAMASEQPVKVDPKLVKTEGTGKRPTSAAAPAGNSGGGMNGGSVQVGLTRGELEASEDGTHTWNYDDKNGKFKKGDPIGRQEFARRKMIMKKQGLYDKTLTE